MRARSALLRGLLFLASALPAGCGSREAAPQAPQEIRIDVNGVTGTPFQVVEIRAQNAVHYPCPPMGLDSFRAPYRFFLENARPDVQIVVDPAGSAPLSDIQIFLGAESVPLRRNDPTAATPVHTGLQPLPVGTPAAPCRGQLLSGAPEVRFDVFGSSLLFTATIGDLLGSHILSGGATPATIYLEDASTRVTGVFTKIDSATDLTVHLYVGGDLVDARTSPAGSAAEVVVKFEF